MENPEVLKEDTDKLNYMKQTNKNHSCHVETPVRTLCCRALVSQILAKLKAPGK